MKKRIPALLLTLCLAFALSVSAFAAGTTTARVPVTLTVANEYRAVNVTVPAALPVAVMNGEVITADNARITKNAKSGAVQVTDISVTDGVYKVGNYDNFSGSKTIALKINGCPTKGEGSLLINDSAFPMIGAGDSQTMSYHVKISGDASNTEEVQAAQVIVTIAIVD